MISNRREMLFLLIGDVLVFIFSLWLPLLARTFTVPSYSYFIEHLRAFVPSFLISLLVFFIAGLYERRTHLMKRVLGTRILGAQLANTLIAAVLFFLLPFQIAPKTILLLYLVISIVLISAWRF